jgi:hypothetical protein
MNVSSHWRTAALMAGALLIGTMVGPAVVQAAAAGLVKIEGARGSHEADVSRGGQLSVNAGLTMTKAGQVETAEASPSAYVIALAPPSCAAGGIYKIPPGKALIITGVDFYLDADSSTPGQLQQDLEVGPSATPCKHIVAAGEATTEIVAQQQVFQPGIAVPAGDAVGLVTADPSGSAEIYGYLVPASAVPASTDRNLPGAGDAGLKP